MLAPSGLDNRLIHVSRTRSCSSTGLAACVHADVGCIHWSMDRCVDLSNVTLQCFGKECACFPRILSFILASIKQSKTRLNVSCCRTSRACVRHDRGLLRPPVPGKRLAAGTRQSVRWISPVGEALNENLPAPSPGEHERVDIGNQSSRHQVYQVFHLFCDQSCRPMQSLCRCVKLDV